jgi:hypothetical protein
VKPIQPGLALLNISIEISEADLTGANQLNQLNQPIN